MILASLPLMNRLRAHAGSRLLVAYGPTLAGRSGRGKLAVLPVCQARAEILCSAHLGLEFCAPQYDLSGAK